MGNDAAYGNILAVETTGASEETAKQDNLNYHGVDASRTMAKTDAGRMEAYRKIIKKVADEFEIPPSLIAAIISRESRAGNTLEDGWGDYDPVTKKYRAFGLMQVDVTDDGGKNDPEGEWDSEEHLRQGTRILVGFIENISKKFPNWNKEQKLKGGIAAYNMGDGNVHSYKKVDKHTTGGDYSNDVVARAIWYERNFFTWCVWL